MDRGFDSRLRYSKVLCYTRHMKTCETCGKNFKVRDKNKPNRFCSKNCRHATFVKVEKACVECNEMFLPERKTQIFCSRRCSAIHNNAKTPKRPVGPYSKKKVVCRRCGIVTYRNLDSEFEFCSVVCRNRNNFEEWLNGTYLIHYDSKYNDFPEWAKVLLAEHVGYQCQAVREDTGFRCTESRMKNSGKTVLEIEHKDGNASNHSPENIELLCPTCHSLTDTHRSGNRGKSTRIWRKEYKRQV